MNAIGAIILSILIFVVLFASKRWALIGMMAGVLYLTQAQSISVAGLNLTAIRFLEIAGFSRVIKRCEFSFSRLNSIDKALILLYSYTTVVFLLRSTEGQAYQVGKIVDATFCYFIFRGLIVGIEEFRWFLRAFLILLAPYMAIVFFERQTGYNLFSVIGAGGGHAFRNGMPRCFGSFRHPVLMGTIGASFLPLYIGLAFEKTARMCALAGIGLCLGIVFLSNSGGPLGAAFTGLVAWLLWGLRTKMFLVRRSIVGILALLALVMKAPIWYLPAKLSSITGGDGWHRSYLIDVAIRNLDKWWFAGMPIKETWDWFPYILAMTGGADITNQYLSFGLTAGLVAIVLFIFLLTQAFRSLGKAMAIARSSSTSPNKAEFMLWGLGVMLTVHISNWIGVNYFDQIYVVWFMQLAAISTLSQTPAEPVLG